MGGSGDDEKPVHTVTLTKGIYAGIFPVTQRQYQAVMGTNPSFHHSWHDLPVDNVSWDDSQEFCGKLSELCGWKIRLPTEAEWEYCCRAGSNTDYGNTGKRNGLISWDRDNTKGDTHRVGETLPNAWGLHDCHGNIWELCDDWYDKDAYQRGDCEDPVVSGRPPLSYGRVRRGGSYADWPKGCTSAARDYFDQSRRDSAVSFRCVAALC